MYRYALIALVGALSAVGAAKAVVSLNEAGHAPQASVADLAAAPKAAVAQIVKASDGHYWAEGVVNGKAVRFLVDTGATAVSLTVDDARRLGLDTGKLSYDYDVLTAQGKARAAAVRLASVSVAGARVEGVDALVIEKGLETSLLGMSYLGRLSKWEASPTALILRP